MTAFRASRTRKAGAQCDGKGNQTQFTDRRGQISNSTFDALDRLKQTTWHDGTRTVYTYDAGDRVTLIEEFASGAVTPNATISRAWDDLNRPSCFPHGQWHYDALSVRSRKRGPGAERLERRHFRLHAFPRKTQQMRTPNPVSARFQ
jgi:YD repeat-containing protein